MNSSKLTFKIVEIPEEESRRTVELSGNDLDVSSYDFRGGVIDLQFYRTLHFIRINFHLDVEVALICDRSLEEYIQPINADYEVLFKVDVQEETENMDGAVRRFNFSSNTLSIAEEVRDTILLNIPIKKIHPKYLDEEGIPRAFETKKFGTIQSPDDDGAIDPRWEKLKEIKN